MLISTLHRESHPDRHYSSAFVETPSTSQFVVCSGPVRLVPPYANHCSYSCPAYPDDRAGTLMMYGIWNPSSGRFKVMNLLEPFYLVLFPTAFLLVFFHFIPLEVLLLYFFGTDIVREACSAHSICMCHVIIFTCTLCEYLYHLFHPSFSLCFHSQIMMIKDFEAAAWVTLN